MKFNYDGEELTIEELRECYKEECNYRQSIGEKVPKFFELLADLEKRGLLTIA